MAGIILEEIGQITEVSTLIDCHNLSVRHSESSAQDHTTNTSKTVNTKTTCHTLLLLCCYGQAAQDRQRPLGDRGCSMAQRVTIKRVPHSPSLLVPPARRTVPRAAPARRHFP